MSERYRNNKLQNEYIKIIIVCIFQKYWIKWIYDSCNYSRVSSVWLNFDLLEGVLWALKSGFLWFCAVGGVVLFSSLWNTAWKSNCVCSFCSGTFGREIVRSAISCMYAYNKLSRVNNAFSLCEVLPQKQLQNSCWSKVGWNCWKRQGYKACCSLEAVPFTKQILITSSTLQQMSCGILCCWGEQRSFACFYFQNAVPAN